MSDYAYPDVLVTTDWVHANFGKSGLCLVEVDVDTQAYDAGHLPGAVGFNWQTQLQDQITRDILSKEAFESLLSGVGIANDHAIVLYGDHSNWFAAYAFWLFKLYGHADVRLMNGGRAKWLSEKDNPLTADKTVRHATHYKATPPDLSQRARVAEVLAASSRRGMQLVDVRSPDEFTGKVIAPPGMTETAQRGGHIPGAKSIPWGSAVNPDGTFKGRGELEATYFRSAGLDPKVETIAYCRIGERSSHTWFVLKYLLGFPAVKNYDGSWTEYGSMVGLPIER
jgi:thiosulfate/3-mercaptopyruvate sulfurtransferase